jgi:hypothetical protein
MEEHSSLSSEHSTHGAMLGIMAALEGETTKAHTLGKYGYPIMVPAVTAHTSWRSAYVGHGMYADPGIDKRLALLSNR